MNVKTKMMIVGAVFTTGALGTVTAFAATSGSVSNATSSTVSSQTNSPSAHRGVGKDGFGHGGFGPGVRGGVGFAWAGSLGSLATTLGIDQQTLQSDLKAGQSLVQIAQGKGMSEQTLISDLEASYKQRLDAAVSSGKLTSTQEQKMLTHFNNNVTKMVERTRGFGHGGFDPGGRRGIGFAGTGSLSSLATTLGIGQQTLQSDLKAGQSLAQIAQGKGMSEQTLISDLEASYKQRLDAAVSSGKLTSTQEQKMQTNFNNNATKMVERTRGFWGNHKAKTGQTTNRSTSSTTTITGN
ncbi:hypothetical protein [Alicyclobacillus mengziensis]|uniref:Uncharacterized protein n=1 Tax=Alicyclobacillus mengziensis TaxID=2931921 RepID=A0A9X7Z6K8_9BACL|nr:hypothetical protein [Alicyclobacillus mengziensis]QSO47492.1 hypothetical protein JZ786_24445 [Alicyclobacillus mengziensis]